jgi:hypothetical protein
MWTKKNLSAVCLSTVLYCGLARPASAEEGWRPKHELVTVTLADDGGPILVPVEIAGRTWSFALHTGASETIVDPWLVKHCGPYTAQAMFDDQELPAYRPGEFLIGGHQIRPDRVLSSSLQAGVRGSYSLPIYGILGMNSLPGVGIHLDWDHRLLTLYDATRPENAPPGKRVDLLVDERGVPFVEADYKGVKVKHRIDTSLDYSGSIDPQNLGELVRTGCAKSCDVTVRRVGGLPDTALYRVNACTLGGGVIECRDLVFPDCGPALLGLGVLSKYNTTISCAEKAIYFEPRRIKSFSDHGDWDGITLDKNQNNSVVVAKVAPGSVTAGLDIRAGDVFVSIDGKSVVDWMPGQVSRAIRLRRKAIKVTLYREGRPVEVTLPE